MGSCSLPSTYKNICHGSYIIVYIQLFFKALDMLWHICGVNIEGLLTLNLMLPRPNRPSRARITFPGEEEARSPEARSPVLLPHRSRCTLRKLWRRGRWVCARQTCSARTLLFLFSFCPPLPTSPPQTQTHWQRRTHIFRLKCCAGRAAAHVVRFLYLGTDISPPER